MNSHIPRALRGIILLSLCLFVIEADANEPLKPDYRELAKKVEIRRDEWGVPHILAPSEEAAALAMGYVQGEDYPLLLSQLFAAARGESAKYFGEKEESKDLRIKSLRLYEDSFERFHELKPNLQAILNAFAAGYDMAIEKYLGEKPPYMRAIEGPDVLAHGRNIVVLEFTMNIGRFAIIKNPAKNGTNSAQATLDGSAMAHALDPYSTDPLPGSNMWAIGKERSASGRGILLANPHLNWAGAQTFYEAHVNIPGVVNISGSTLIGNPGITIGFNEYLGWSHTVNIFDSLDIVEMEDDPAHPGNYLYDGLSIPYGKREIEIEVKTDGGIEKRKRTILDTHIGPITMEKDGKRYVQKTPNEKEIRMLEQWNLMGKARSLKEFKDALDMVAIPMFNIACADREGNCFYIYNGRIPQRPDGFPWEGTVPGNTSRADWTTVHPVSELPQLTNPKGGYVQNCNDAPWYTNAHQIIDKNQFPFYFCEDGFKLRSQLSVEMLESDNSITLDEVKAFKFNTKMLSADRYKDDLIRVIKSAPEKTPEMEQALKLLSDWDNHANWDSRGAVLFSEWFLIFNGKGRGVIKKPWTPDDPYKTPAGIGDEAAALDALKAAIEKIKNDYGKLDPAWGDVFYMQRGEKRLPVAGGAAELGFFRALASKTVPKEEAKIPGEHRCVGGDSYVLAVEFTEPPTAYSVCAYGETEKMDSPHFSDQSELFAKNQFKKVYFTEDDVKAHAKRTYHPGE